MNKGTKIRTALRIAFSIYTAFCMWQVSIGELSKQLNAPCMYYGAYGGNNGVYNDSMIVPYKIYGIRGNTN